MFSAIVELAAFAAMVRGVDVLAGPGWAWIAAGILGTIVGMGTSDTAIRRTLLRVLSRLLRIRLWRRKTPIRPVSPHPELRVDETEMEFAQWAADSAERRMAAARE